MSILPSFISSLFENRQYKTEHHKLSDSPTSGGKQKTELAEDSVARGDLKAWERKFPVEHCVLGGPTKTYLYVQQVLSGLLEGHTLSRANTDEIGCHLWAISEESKRKMGGDSMHFCLFRNLPDILGEKNQELSAKIRCAMIGSSKREAYEEKCHKEDR